MKINREISLNGRERDIPVSITVCEGTKVAYRSKCELDLFRCTSML